MRIPFKEAHPTVSKDVEGLGRRLKHTSVCTDQQSTSSPNLSSAFLLVQ